MFKTILAGLIIGIIIVAGSDINHDPGKNVSSTPSGYGTCLNDPTVQFQAGMYKQKYPSASTDQIMHILCKDK